MCKCCYTCGEEIEKGDRYYHYIITVNGWPVEVNLCETCMKDGEEVEE